jgi:hypothetical protein
MCWHQGELLYEACVVQLRSQATIDLTRERVLGTQAVTLPPFCG